jgi:hypothetical protein
MTKAGSSALQAGLFSVRQQLADSGVLYPVGGRVKNSHILLLQGLLPPGRLPRGLRRLYGDDVAALERDMQAWLAGVKTSIDATRPHTVVLSEEFLFYVVEDGALTELRRRLLSLGDSVEVVVYIRRPSEHYLSSVQQLLKASHRIPGPNPVAYRPTIEGYANHVADRLHVVKYDRDNWHGGDILRQFLSAFVPDAKLPESAPTKQVNESLSAEAMSLLAEYRSRVWPDEHNRFTEDTNRIVQALASSDVEVAGNRVACLHQDVARMVDRTSTDLPWLRDTYGVDFDGVDYSAIRPADGHHPPFPSIDCMCPVDPDRRDELMWRVVRRLAQDGVGDRPLELASAGPPAAPGNGSLARRLAGVVRGRGRRPTGRG